MENALAGELTGLGLALRRVLPLLGLASSTWHYRHHPRPRVSDPVPQENRAYPCRLDPAEQEQVLHLLKTAFACEQSVFQAWYDALDAGDPVASMSTWFLEWDAPAGQHDITVRATDLTGAVQVEKRASPFPRGATGWQSIPVNVE